MKQLHCGNSNTASEQSFSLGETMFEYAVHRHVSGMLHSCYRQFTAQDRTWPGQTWAMGVWLYTAHGINKSYILHKQATLAKQQNGTNKPHYLHSIHSHNNHHLQSKHYISYIHIHAFPKGHLQLIAYIQGAFQSYIVSIPTCIVSPVFIILLKHRV